LEDDESEGSQGERAAEQGAPRDLLSPRQIECLQLAARGLTSAQIAHDLGISARTVDQYFGEACERLRVRNRTQAVARAIALELIAQPPP
jgi:DNA-binding CsgD family transcriptional regulator